MRHRLSLCLSLLAVFVLAFPLLAQAGRFPLPRPPMGGGSHFLPHLPWHGSGGGEWIAVALVLAGLVLLGFVGWHVGRWLGGARAGENTSAGPFPFTFTADPAPGTGLSADSTDLILPACAVQAKAERTTRLLSYLAYAEDRSLEPSALRRRFHEAFLRVQGCWQQRDYALLADLLLPSLRREHERQLAEMKRRGLINRLDDLNVTRLEFAHLDWPGATSGAECTALITFEAASYFVQDRTGDFKEGTKETRRFQEFWVFRQVAGAWRLAAIERSHLSERLARPNAVAGMNLTAEQIENLQHSIVL